MGKPPRSPLVGYNHNLSHLGRVFHIQTEDSGPVAPRLFTHLFYQGTILASRKHEYDATLPDDQVRALMQAQHKTVMKDLVRARLDAVIIPFFASRGEDVAPVQGAVPMAARSETPGPVLVLPQLARTMAAGSVAAEAAIASATVSAVSGVIISPDPAPPIAGAVAVRSSEGGELGAGAPAPESGTQGTPAAPAGAPRRRATRSFEAGVGRGPTPTPVVVRATDGRRSPFVRNGPPAAARMSSTDGVVVQRNVVVGVAGDGSTRGARIRPPVPYVVTGGGHTERPPKGGAQHLATPGAAGAVGPSGAAVDSAVVPSSSSSSPPSPSAPPPTVSPSGTPGPSHHPRTTGAFGVGLGDDKSLDEVILEYLSEDGDKP